MAHKTSAGSKAGQGGNVRGKRLGIKLSHGCFVKPGQIIVRQRGKKFHPGKEVRSFILEGIQRLVEILLFMQRLRV